MFQVEGKKAPGPLFDFGLLMFHCGKILLENKSGPFFYLSKVMFPLSLSPPSLSIEQFNKIYYNK